jgi:hypothetical protein
MSHPTFLYFRPLITHDFVMFYDVFPQSGQRTGKPKIRASASPALASAQSFNFRFRQS